MDFLFDKKLSRRDLMIYAASMGISLYAAEYILGADSAMAAKPAKTPVKAALAVSKNKPPAQMTIEVINKLGGIKKFVKPGDIVVLKPNIAWDRGPGYGANTSPEIVVTMAKLCKDAGAKKVKVFDNPCVDNKISYAQSGIMKMARAVGADVHYLDDRGLKDMNLKGSRIKLWPVYTEVVEANKLINLPIAKHHSSSTLSMGMKNWMGAVGGDRGQMHFALHDYIADLARFFRPDLTVVDLTKVLIRNGPQGGELSDVKAFNTVIAGTDVVAIDSYAAATLGHRPADIRYIKLAVSYGLGTMDYKKLLSA